MADEMESPLGTIERLLRATNAHDLEGVVACFAEDYALDAPLHPQRSFRGRDQVRRNWTQIFAGVPDITTRVVRSATDGATLWTEWEMSGTRRDGGAHLLRGVFIFGIGGGLIRTGRMFLEPVEESGPGMDRAISAQLAARGSGGAE
jgi:ketosteroid isomerase-like protein